MDMATIIAFGIGFFAGGATVAYFVYLNHKIYSEDWGDPDQHEDIDYADIPSFLRRQAD
jgi:hypothetical protein